jgi:hypothetical protein
MEQLQNCVGRRDAWEGLSREGNHQQDFGQFGKLDIRSSFREISALRTQVGAFGLQVEYLEASMLYKVFERLKEENDSDTSQVPKSIGVPLCISERNRVINTSESLGGGAARPRHRE